MKPFRSRSRDQTTKSDIYYIGNANIIENNHDDGLQHSYVTYHGHMNYHQNFHFCQNESSDYGSDTEDDMQQGKLQFLSHI